MYTPLIIAVVIVILGIMGFNIFTYLARTTNWLGKQTVNVAKETEQVGKVVGEGTLGAVEGGIQGTIQGAIQGSQQELDLNLDDSPDERSINAKDSMWMTAYHPRRSSISNRKYNIDSLDQNNSEIGKEGYCLVGHEGMDGRMNRACVRVGVNDKCMSNKIYPTMAVCINPSLRA